jgi:hypothetical protein
MRYREFHIYSFIYLSTYLSREGEREGEKERKREPESLRVGLGNWYDLDANSWALVNMVGSVDCTEEKSEGCFCLGTVLASGKRSENGCMWR